MSDQSASEIKYTAIVTMVIDCQFPAAIVIEGNHDLQADGFNPLNHELFAMWVNLDDGRMTEIEDDMVATRLMSETTMALYMIHGDIVTAEPETVTQTSLDAETLTAAMADGRTIEFTVAGTVSVWNGDLENEDFYQIGIANPRPGEHLVLLLEVLGESPLEFRQVRLDDDDLVQQIIKRFLEELNATYDEGEGEE